jgi:16S rRNA (adenine1518-N6/adenine1519-N6)-dimethyltransferase
MAGYPSPPALLRKYGLRAKKSWGQNFLADEAILDAIAALAVAEPGERVVELGAGLGHLTARLLLRGAEVLAVERDRDMARVLRGELGDRVAVLEADAARLDYGELARRPSASAGVPDAAPAPRQVAVVGNLPYHLTSPILFRLLDQSGWVSRAVLLLQREVAERLAAAPGSRTWGLLSVLLQQRAEVTLERLVPPGAFHPAPRVESAVVRISFGAPPVEVADPERFRRLVKAGFAQRRKTLGNALRGGRIAPAESLARALASSGVDPARRAETLTVAEWAALERLLPRE